MFRGTLPGRLRHAGRQARAAAHHRRPARHAAGCATRSTSSLVPLTPRRPSRSSSFQPSCGAPPAHPHAKKGHRTMQPRSSSHCPGLHAHQLLVVIAIIAILAAILFPVFAQARERRGRSAASPAPGRSGWRCSRPFRTTTKPSFPTITRWPPCREPSRRTGATSCGHYQEQPGVHLSRNQPTLRSAGRPPRDLRRARDGIVINNVYFSNRTLGMIFEKDPGDGSRNPSKLAEIEDVVGTVFCADGGDFEERVEHRLTAQVATGSPASFPLRRQNRRPVSRGRPTSSPAITRAATPPSWWPLQVAQDPAGSARRG